MHCLENIKRRNLYWEKMEIDKEKGKVINLIVNDLFKCSNKRYFSDPQRKELQESWFIKTNTKILFRTFGKKNGD